LLVFVGQYCHGKDKGGVSVIPHPIELTYCVAFWLRFRVI
jgi:hypothetical protein